MHLGIWRCWPFLVVCGLRRHETVEWNVSDLPRWEDHWAIVDPIGKASHIRTIPVPDWVKDLIDDWLQSAGISTGKIFRRVTRSGTVWGSGLSEKVAWHVVRQYARKAGVEKLAPHGLRANLRSALSSGWWRTRSNPVLAWTCICANNRTIPSLQAADSRPVNDRIGIQTRRRFRSVL
jgi:integrase